MPYILDSYKIVEHPHLYREVTRVKRMLGGYKFRWLIRTEVKELEQFAVICGDIKTMYITPETAAIIRGLKK